MIGVLLLMVYLLAGCAIVRLLLPRTRAVARVWLGVSLGVVLMMWLPALAAFFVRFSRLGHYLSLIPLMLLVLAAWLLRDHSEAKGFDEADKRLMLALACVALPLTILGGYLQWTHVLEPAADGSLHVGQSTYGDLNLHLAIVTSLRNAAFPADYSFFPGELLAYPFLADSFSTSFMLFGMSLRAAFVVPGILMMALTFSGYVILAERIAKSKNAAIIASLLFFLNGGLGFFYLFDMQGSVLGSARDNPLQSVSGLWERIQAVLQGWYQSPTNHADYATYNLRMSNVLCDMMIPQRTTLGGWTELLPCLYLLYDAVGESAQRRYGLTLRRIQNKPTAVYTRRVLDYRKLALLGVWAGMLPMVNTHCFLALGMLSAGWLAYDLIVSRDQWREVAVPWAIYGALAIAVALPQLMTWTFRQASGSDHFLTIWFNWVNNPGRRGLRDGYFWFYCKNIGLPFVLLLLALFEREKKWRFLASGAFVIFVLAEFIRFQPNEYDNYKLFCVWYMFAAIIVAEYAMKLWRALKRVRAKYMIAVLCAFLCFTSAIITISAECVSDYVMFDAEDVEAAAYLEDNTPRDSVVLTWSQHINPVSSLAGRTIVCGPDIWLFYHGFDTVAREAEIKRFYKDPVGNMNVLQKYGVDYIVLGPYETGDAEADAVVLNRLFPCVFQSSGQKIAIYKVDKEALAGD